MKHPIRILGVRQNNLKNITVEFPYKKLCVVTGLSGSGKSSLAFDTLYAEGQRRYVESLSTYTRQFLEKMPKPDIDSIQNIPPAIALEQRNHVLNSRSTVGSQTEVIDYLRLLYAKIGKTQCMSCGSEVKKIDTATVLAWALEWLPGRKALITAPLQTEPLPQKSGKKKPPKSSQSAASLFQVLREQGFKRVLFNPGNKKDFEILEIDQPDSLPNVPAQAFALGQLHVVIDRIKMTQTKEGPSADTRGRLLDSIDQAIAIGHGKVGFFDIDSGESQEFNRLFACIRCGREHRLPDPHLFAFNSPLGACSCCSGFGYTLELAESLIVPDPSKTLKNGAIDPFSKPSFLDWQTEMFKFAERNDISLGKRYRELTPTQRKLLWEGDPDQPKKYPGIIGCFEELKRKKYKLHVRVFIRRYQTQNLCPECQGTRLKPDALAVSVGGIHIAQTLALPVSEALTHFNQLKLSAVEKKISADILSQIQRRLSFLDEVGVGYLSLSRLTKSLSGGEFQRINLATQIGNGLCGTLYILDEPSIGLHAADTNRLIKILHRLRDQGNTVVVVEHDLEVMRQADWLIELGPGAGRRGGELVAQGSAAVLIATPGSITGKYLSGAFTIPRPAHPRSPAKRVLKLTGCRQNNLQNLTLEFPLDRFVVVTGVSGSGKSTLVHKTLYTALSRLFEHSTHSATDPVGTYDRLYGAEQLSGVVLLDQSSIGKTSRSNPATYLKAWDEVRRLYSNQSLSMRRGYTPQHFSFNVDGGRCSVCKGEGEITLDMHFMAEVKLPCEECQGKRFKKNVLEVTYRGKNISQLLNSTIDETFDLFRDNPVLARKLGILRDVGLGYLQLGQSAPTLSGGESQRLKIAATLENRQASNLLYIFDEPTTGLHLEDIKKLLGVIQDLVSARHSVIMIEHHLDVIAQADWVIDLGPGGGNHGGQLMAQGAPSQLVKNPDSVTGAMLREQGFVFMPSA